MHLAILILIAILTSRADAQVLDLDHLSLDVSRFSCLREPMTPEIECNQYKGSVRLNWNVSLLGDYVKWRNDITGQGTYSKFTTYEWHYMVSIPTRFGIEPFIEHRSRHTLDQPQPTYEGQTKPTKFPIADSYGVRFTFYEK